MTYKYNDIIYDVEFVQVEGEELDIWIQNPDDLDDFYYMDELPESDADKIQDLVFFSVKSEKDDEWML